LKRRGVNCFWLFLEKEGSELSLALPLCCLQVLLYTAFNLSFMRRAGYLGREKVSYGKS